MSFYYSRTTILRDQQRYIHLYRCCSTSSFRIYQRSTSSRTRPVCRLIASIWTVMESDLASDTVLIIYFNSSSRCHASSSYSFNQVVTEVTSQDWLATLVLVWEALQSWEGAEAFLVERGGTERPDLNFEARDGDKLLDLIWIPFPSPPIALGFLLLSIRPLVECVKV